MRTLSQTTSHRIGVDGYTHCVYTYYMTRKNVYIRKDNESRWNDIDSPSAWINEHLTKMAKLKAKVTDADAEINGGALVEVARIMGKPLYMRVNHHDPELARHELAEMRSIIKDVVLGDDETTPFSPSITIK
jgi:hypothetical protein